MTCAPHKILYWCGSGGVAVLGVQHYSRCNPPPCLPRHQRLPVLERGRDGSLPPYAGPLVGPWRGERDEAGRGPLKHTPKGLFMSKLNLTEHVYSQARKKQRTELKQQQTRLTRKCKTFNVKYFDFKKEEITENLLSAKQFCEKKASYIYVLD